MIRRQSMGHRYNRLGEIFGLISAWAAEDAEDETLTPEEMSAYVSALQDAGAGLDAARAALQNAMDRLDRDPMLPEVAC
jgi:hypothetical protein